MSSLQNVLGTATSHERQRASLDPYKGIRIVLLAKTHSLKAFFLDLPLANYHDSSDAHKLTDSYERFGVDIDVVTRRNLVSSLRRTVIVNVFRIDDPRTFRISKHKSDCHLLVGVYSDVLPSPRPAHCFPSKFGPLLAECIGADRYVECSSTNKDKVFEEAVRVVFSANEHKFLDKQLHGMLLNQGTTDSDEWISVMEQQTKITKLYPTFASDFADDLNTLRKEMELAIQQDTVESKNVCQGLETERLRLSHRKFEKFPKTSSKPCCSLWYIPETVNQTRVHMLANTEELPFRMEGLPVSSKPSDPINLYFHEQRCQSIVNYFTKFGSILIRSLVIVDCPGTLNLSFLTKLNGLKYLVIVNTEVDITHGTFSSTIYGTMNHLVLNNCGLTELPSKIGYLSNLQLLNIANNGIAKLPKALGFLKNLRTLLLDHDKILFPPANVLSKSVQDVISFLEASKKEEVENKEAKLIVVGQERVGKSTLIKAMKHNNCYTKTDPPSKTDGVDISKLHLGGFECKVYDMAGDVEYLNTHSLFLSSKCLYLTVFDLSQIIVGEGTRSADHLCRLELWLQTIASQDPSSYVIIVGTHADHSLLSRKVLQKQRQLVVHLLAKYRAAHKNSNKKTDLECILCNPKKVFYHFKCSWPSGEPEKNDGNTPEIVNCMPHIVDYFEVSGIRKYPHYYLSMSNISVKQLKKSIACSIDRLASITSTRKIPKSWLSFREAIRDMLSADTGLIQQPVIPFTQINSIAMDKGIFLERKEVVAMLRFFHFQGTFLWYEDLPEMKDVVIIDPQWLSDKLRTLISHRSSVSAFIHNGIINLADLPKIWPHISQENRKKLLDLFRSVRLCFSISETEELFPCNLPVGWPNKDMWPPFLNPPVKQTSLLFLFNFIPPSFFTDLIVEVNKRRPSFACNVKPLYYRFHIVYIIKSPQDATYDEDNSEESECVKTQEPVILHRVHYELMPYNDSLQVSVRGPQPRSILPDVRSMIETVKHRRYPGISYSERLLCPECVIQKVCNPATFVLDKKHDGACTKGHEVGNFEAILDGKLTSSTITFSPIDVIHKALQDSDCPKLFVILPINLEGLSFTDYVLSYIRDGYAVHLLCECPEQWHFVNFPGFRVNKPKEFFKKHGDRVCKVLKVVSTLSIPLKFASSLDPHSKIGAAVGQGASSVCEKLQSLLDSYVDRYPYLQSSLLGSPEEDLKDLKKSSGLQRSDLSRFLEVEAKGRSFGPLVCTYVPKHDELLWLCEEHSRRFETVKE